MPGAAELLDRAQAGKAAAFAELVRRYRGLVFAACFEHTGDFADSEDLTQEVFLAAHRGLSALEHPEKFAGWLRGIARNLCRMHLRRFQPETLFTEAHVVPEGVAEPARAVEQQHLLHDALLGVTDRSREVLSLHYLGGYSYREIGRLCQLPLRTVRSRLHEGRAQLKSRLLEVVGELCRCSRSSEHTARCTLERCGQEPCACVSRLTAD